MNKKFIYIGLGAAALLGAYIYISNKKRRRRRRNNLQQQAPEDARLTKLQSIEKGGAFPISDINEIV